MKNLQKYRSIIRGMVAGAAIMACTPFAKAIPFASCITNTSGTISFYLNETNGNVTVSYGDGTTNASYNGVTTGTNLASGVHSFTMPGTNTIYKISVSTLGSGVAHLVQSFPIGSGRGMACNVNGASTNFGYMYFTQSSGTTPLYRFNSDLSTSIGAVSAGTTWGGPYRLSVGPDDNVYVSDLNYSSYANSMVYMATPNLSGGQLFLGPVGEGAPTVHASELSEIQIQGTAPNEVFFIVDGDFAAQNESILGYNYGDNANLPWETAPFVIGPQITPIGPEASFGNVYAQMTQSTVTNLLYVSNQRNNFACADLQIYAPPTSGTPSNLVWDSGLPLFAVSPNITNDWFVNAGNGGATTLGGLVASAVAPSGHYFVGVGIDNHMTVVALTNGIPDVSTIYYITPPSFGQNGRGCAMDAGDNIFVSSSGASTIWEFDLGLSGTAVTTGTTAGPTSFKLTYPATTVTIAATTPTASQGGANGTTGTPVPGVFTITRTGNTSSPLTVNLTLSGTATNGVYTTTPSAGIIVDGAGTIVIPAGQSNVTLTVTPTTNNIPRTLTTAICTINAGAYNVNAPFQATVNIINTSSQQMSVAPLANMYKAFSNDFAEFILTRLGDTNVPTYTVSTFTFSGTAVLGTDYTAPTNITFNPGDVSYTNIMYPLVGGNPPVDTANPTYIGNLSINVSVSAGSGYAAAVTTATMFSIDNANPPATVLWSDPLTSGSDSNTWIVTAANGNMTVDTNDYEVDFGFDITANNPGYGSGGAGYGVITNPPSGATNVLRITCNKDGSAGCNGGVNAFPNPSSVGPFSGNYAVRFYMCDVQGTDPGIATEGPLFGINHLSKGITTNWYTGSGFTSELPGLTSWPSDGVWYWMDGQAGGESDGDYVEFTGITNTYPNTGFQILNGAFGGTFVNNFKYPYPYNTFNYYTTTGMPANESFNASSPQFPYNGGIPVLANTWADVEIKQINGIVTLSIDKTPIFVYTNTSGWTSGVPMLGYEDPFNSIQDESSAAFYSDIRVVQIGPPVITQTIDSGGNVTLRFVTQDGDDTTSSFTLLSSGTASVPNNVDTVTAGTFTQLGSGAFQVVTATPTNRAAFYRIKHN